MRNIVQHRRLILAPADGRRRSRTRLPRVRRDRQRRVREKKGAVPALVTLGSLVDIPAWNFPRRRVLAERRPSSGLVRQMSSPEATEKNGKEPKAMSSRSLEQAWLEQHQTEYPGAWVALEGARLVAQGSSARQVLDAAKAEGYDQPLVVHISSGPELPFGGW